MSVQSNTEAGCKGYQKPKLQNYNRPELVEFGTVLDLTNATSNMGAPDGGFGSTKKTSIP